MRGAAGVASAAGGAGAVSNDAPARMRGAGLSVEATGGGIAWIADGVKLDMTARERSQKTELVETDYLEVLAQPATA